MYDLVFPGLVTDDENLCTEKVEQIFNAITKIFAQHNLSYESSKAVLEIVIEKLGKAYFLKSSSD